MFKKILIPTDGSKLSAQAANKGVCFARTIGAEVVALQAARQFERYTGVALTPEQIARASAFSRSE